MLLATALAPAIMRMALTDVLLFKQTGSSSTKGNHHPSFLLVFTSMKKTVDAAALQAAQKMLLKQKTQQNICKWIARFYYFSIYTPLEACVLLTIIA